MTVLHGLPNHILSLLFEQNATVHALKTAILRGIGREKRSGWTEAATIFGRWAWWA